MINIRMAIEQALHSLNKLNTDGRLEAELLLAHLLNKNRAYLFAHPEVILSQIQLEAYSTLITKRAHGVPIAYLIGYRDFWSLSLKVSNHTLIPRHETERLVELALELIPDKPNTRVLDLGTGSGAIALAIAKEKPTWNITACDYSVEALDIARENAKENNINNICFYHSNWFKNLPDQHYHAILSNPPYIAEQDPHLFQGDIRFEPRSALVSGDEGLADLKYISQHSYNRLLPNGLLLMEHGYDQKNFIGTILNKLGYLDVQCWQDIQGHDRVSGGWRPEIAA